MNTKVLGPIIFKTYDSMCNSGVQFKTKQKVYETQNPVGKLQYAVILQARGQ